MATFIKMVWKWIAPPENASEKDLAVWRSGLSMFVFFDFLALVCVILIVSGFVGPGFANRDEIESIKETLLEREIMELRRKQCEAIQSENRAALNFATDSIQRRQRESMRLSNRELSLPSCLEVGVRVSERD